MSRTDVRMSGFRSRATVAEAWSWLDAAVAAIPPAVERVPLESACHRTLAEDVVAGADVPAFDRSAMDGYAVRSRETVAATEYNPLLLRIVGTSLPGQAAHRGLEAGQAIRIMTGAPLPEGADAVVPAECATVSGEIVSVETAVSVDRHISRRGEDVRAGEVVVPAGRRLRPQDVAVVASLGVSGLTIRRPPRVRIVATGNELVPPGGARGLHQIYEVNSLLLRGLLPLDGGTLESVQLLPDDRETLRAALTAPGADVLLVSGGSSVGAEDFAPLVVREEGELAIHGVAMRPSSPAGLGRLGAALVCLLPGNPVSCLCAYEFFAARAIRQLAGLSGEWPHRRVRGRLTRKVSSLVGRTDFCRVQIRGDEVHPLAISGAAILSSTTRADGFLIVPPESEGLAEGSEVEALLFR